MQSLISTLHAKFSLKSFGMLNYLLGIEVTKLPINDVFFNQSEYIKDHFIKAHMENSKPTITHMATEYSLSTHIGDLFDDATYYKSMLSALVYITITCFDLSYEMNRVHQFIYSPHVPH